VSAKVYILRIELGPFPARLRGTPTLSKLCPDQQLIFCDGIAVFEFFLEKVMDIALQVVVVDVRNRIFPSVLRDWRLRALALLKYDFLCAPEVHIPVAQTFWIFLLSSVQS
jgi:hypothetical protein